MFSIRWEWLSKAPQTGSSWEVGFRPKQQQKKRKKERKKYLKDEDMEKLSKSPPSPSPNTA